MVPSSKTWSRSVHRPRRSLPPGPLPSLPHASKSADLQRAQVKAGRVQGRRANRSRGAQSNQRRTGVRQGSRECGQMAATTARSRMGERGSADLRPGQSSCPTPSPRGTCTTSTETATGLPAPNTDSSTRAMPLPHWMTMARRARLACSPGTAGDGLDVSPLDGLFELVAPVVVGGRDRRERAASVRAEQ